MYLYLLIFKHPVIYKEQEEESERKREVVTKQDTKKDLILISGIRLLTAKETILKKINNIHCSFLPR